MDNRLVVREFAAVGRCILHGGIATSLIVGPSLAAQESPPIGSLVPRQSEKWMSERARNRNPEAARRAANEGHDALRRFASCVVLSSASKRNLTNLLSFLNVSPDDHRAQGLAVKISKGSCIDYRGATGSSLRFDTGLLRGAIFRQFYIAHNAQPSPFLQHDKLTSAFLIAADGPFLANQRFADCIVAADHAAADNFIRANVASDQQNASLRFLAGKMSGCLTKGATLQMSRVVLDALLSEALYRKATTVSTPASSVQK